MISSYSGDRKFNNKLRKFTLLGVHLQAAAVPLGNNIVTQRQTQAGSLAGGLGGKEWLHYFVFDFIRNAKR